MISLLPAATRLFDASLQLVVYAIGLCVTFYLSAGIESEKETNGKQRKKESKFKINRKKRKVFLLPLAVTKRQLTKPHTSEELLAFVVCSSSLRSVTS